MKYVYLVLLYMEDQLFLNWAIPSLESLPSLLEFIKKEYHFEFKEDPFYKGVGLPRYIGTGKHTYITLKVVPMPIWDWE